MIVRSTVALVASVSAAGLLLAVPPACGQTYQKPIRIITSGAGGTPDIVARLVGQGVTASLGQPAVVENHPDSVVGDIGATAAPDGSNIVVGGGTFLFGPLLQRMNYDAIRDFAAVTLVTISPNVLVVTPSLPAKSVSDLIALARARPGELNYATTGTGSGAHLSMELLISMVGNLNMVRVNYKSVPAGLNEVGTGQVQMMIVGLGGAMPLVASRRLKALAITTAEPSALAPGLPTIADTGVPGYVSDLRIGVYAPVKTPAAYINKYNQDIVRFINRPDIKVKFLQSGADVVGNSPQEFADSTRAEVAKWGRVIQQAGIKPQ
jgi:tripartite-type tricarboxylate transporter receptor subunit TctC